MVGAFDANNNLTAMRCGFPDSQSLPSSNAQFLPQLQLSVIFIVSTTFLKNFFFYTDP